MAFLLVAVVFPRAGYALRARLVRWWSAKLLRILRIVLDVHGRNPDWLAPNLVIAANHVSWLDIFVINAVRPTRFIAKSEIRDWPLVGWLCEKSGTIFIKRAKRSDTAKINQVIHDVLGAGDCIGLFPEGTTTAGDRLRKFHSSLFEPAVANGALVMPAALRYRTDDGTTSTAPAYFDDVTFSESMGRIIREPKLIAEITFGETLAASGSTRRDLARHCEQVIARILDLEVSNEPLALGGTAIAARTETFEDD